MMRKIYIAHPLRGDVKARKEKAKKYSIADNSADVVTENMAKITNILRHLALEKPDLFLFSPIHAFNYWEDMDDDEWILGQCMEMIATCDEVWVYGDWETSKGCRMEIEEARRLGKIVVLRILGVEGVRTRLIESDYKEGDGNWCGDEENYTFECPCGKGHVYEFHDHTIGYRMAGVGLNCPECEKVWTIKKTNVRAWQLYRK